ncbi:MAG: asparagine synthase-related protein, partial [Bacteroidetes bacterium]|nr:asparagine synthase-related protein [Bacteroidota bacterium]
NDRVSMMSSTELREPFLDHRLFEVAFQQPADFKIKNDSGKYFMRRLLNTMLPGSVVEAPKRALQTPQREWLRTSLKGWAEMHISNALSQHKNDWLNETEVWKSWKEFLDEKSDNSFYIWQWISISLMGV